MYRETSIYKKMVLKKNNAPSTRRWVRNTGSISYVYWSGRKQRHHQWGHCYQSQKWFIYMRVLLAIIYIYTGISHHFKRRNVFKPRSRNVETLELGKFWTWERVQGYPQIQRRNTFAIFTIVGLGNCIDLTSLNRSQFSNLTFLRCW